jgi:hypothetical protein
LYKEKEGAESIYIYGYEQETREEEGEGMQVWKR